jgi:hypothetical protein
MHFTSLQFHFIAADGRPVRSPIPLHVLRGLFMNIVSAVNPALATTMHEVIYHNCKWSARTSMSRITCFPRC